MNNNRDWSKVKRNRPYTIGIKMSEEEKTDLEKACSKLGVNKIQFILKAVREVLKDDNK